MKNSMRRLAAVSILLLAGIASAQTPTSGNVFVGYSYFRTQFTVPHANLNGWEGSFEKRVFPFVGIVADFSAHYGSENFVNPAATCAIGAVCLTSTDTHQENVLFGPRVSAQAGNWRPFAEALFGFSHVNSSEFGSDTSFAAAFGGGLDYRIIRPIALRFQADYIRTSLASITQHNARISTGVVFRF